MVVPSSIQAWGPEHGPGEVAQVKKLVRMIVAALPLWALILTLALAACHPNKTPRPPADGGPLVLAPFEIVDVQGRMVMRMDGGGRVLASWVVRDQAGNRSVEERDDGITLAASGELRLGGTLYARFNADGLLVGADGKPLVAVAGDGSFIGGDGTAYSWASDGSLLLGDRPAGMRLIPADTPARRAASIALWVYLTPLGVPEVRQI